MTRMQWTLITMFLVVHLRKNVFRLNFDENNPRWRFEFILRGYNKYKKTRFQWFYF